MTGSLFVIIAGFNAAAYGHFRASVIFDNSHRDTSFRFDVLSISGFAAFIAGAFLRLRFLVSCQGTSQNMIKQVAFCVSSLVKWSIWHYTNP